MGKSEQQHDPTDLDALLGGRIEHEQRRAGRGNNAGRTETRTERGLEESGDRADGIIDAATGTARDIANEGEDIADPTNRRRGEEDEAVSSGTATERQGERRSRSDETGNRKGKRKDEREREDESRSRV